MNGQTYRSKQITLYNGDFRDLKHGGPEDFDSEGFDLIHADPPWAYANKGCRGNASDKYEGLSFEDIAEHLLVDCFYRSGRDAYLLCWATYPHLWDIFRAFQAKARDVQETWSYVTGGSWHKLGDNPELPSGLGVGFHCRGDAEPFLLFRRGRPRPITTPSNAVHALPTIHTDRTKHSRKPLTATHRFVSAYAPEGGRVFEPYAGDSASCALACRELGRTYVGAEIDEKRWKTAVDKLRQKSLFSTYGGSDEFEN